MNPNNKRHLKKVLVWGGGASAALAALSLLKYPPIIAVSILTGAALSLFNLFAIIRLVEALTGIASSGPGSGKAAKFLTGMMHAFKLAGVFVVLFLLAYLKLINLFGLLVGFTLILGFNILTGLSGLKGDGEGAG